MAETLALDALDTTIDPAKIKEAGYVGVLGYTRVLTAARVSALQAVGLGVGSIYEYSAAESLGGAVAGAADGARAAGQLNTLRQPTGTLHVVNLADFQPTASQIDAIAAYYEAYIQRVGAWQYGAYGTGYVINQLVARGLPGVMWQNAMDDQGVKGDVVVDGAWLYQRVRPTLSIPGASYDENVVMRDGVHWWMKATQPAPPPTPLPHPTPIPPKPPVQPTPIPTLRGVTVNLRQLQQSAVGEDVRALQTLLNMRGEPVSQDGDFGPRTENAVRQYQAKMRLGVDGIVGAHTWGALLGTPQ